MNNAIDLLQTMVQIDSPTGYEHKMADFLVQYFSKRNILVEKDPMGNVFVRVDGEGEPLFLSAHMDTVEPGRGIVARVIDGEVRSSGSTILGADNKATIAVLLAVIDKLPSMHRPLELLFTVDEESKNSGAKGFDYTKLRAKKGVIADIAGPIGAIVTESPAYMRFHISLIGKAGHAAFPDKAGSVVTALGHLLSDVKTGILDENTILNFGIIHAGESRNTIPGNAVIEGEIRGFDEKALNRHFQTAYKQWGAIAKTFRLKIQITHEVDNRGYVFRKQDPFLMEIVKVFTLQDISPRFLRSWSCSDANIFNQKGIQVINVADGTRKTHTVNESIHVSDMEKLMNIFLSFMTGINV